MSREENKVMSYSGEVFKINIFGMREVTYHLVKVWVADFVYEQKPVTNLQEGAQSLLERHAAIFKRPVDESFAYEKEYEEGRLPTESKDLASVPLGSRNFIIKRNQYLLKIALSKARKVRDKSLTYPMRLCGGGFPEVEVDSAAVFAEPLGFISKGNGMIVGRITLWGAGLNFFRCAAAAFTGAGLSRKYFVVNLANSSFDDLAFIKDFATNNRLVLNLQNLRDRGMAFVAALKEVQELPQMIIANAKMSIDSLISGFVFERAELVVAEADALSEGKETPAALEKRSFEAAVSHILRAWVGFQYSLSMSIEGSEDASINASGFVKSEVLSPDSKGVSASFVGGDFSGLISAVSSLKSVSEDVLFRVGDYARPDDSDLHEAFNAALDLAGDDFGLDADQIAKLKEAVMLETGLVDKEEAVKLLTALDEYNNSGSAASCTIS